MYFDKAADLRLAITFWSALTMSALLFVYLTVHAYFFATTSDNGLGSFWFTPTFLVLGATIIVLIAIAYMTTLSKYMDRYKVKMLITCMLDAFEDCSVGASPMVFGCVDGINVLVSRRKSGAYLVVVETPYGIQRELVVQPYRIDKGGDAGKLLPMKELPYIQALVIFINAHLDFSDLTLSRPTGAVQTLSDAQLS